MKYSPQLVKERIVSLNGKLTYIPLNTGKPYSIAGTDVRFFKLKRSEHLLELIVEKGAKVSSLVKRHGADLGINFPFFDPPTQVPIGYVWNNGKYINGAYGEMKDWYEIGFKNGSATIGKFTNAQREQCDFSVQGKILIADGKMVWKNDGQRCQRTFVGIDAAGDTLVGIADGRTGSDQGLTCEEMALFMKDKGAAWAIEGDGGGSTILANQAGGINQSINVGANERVVHHAMLIFFKEDGYKDSDNITYGDLKKLGLIK